MTILSSEDFSEASIESVFGLEIEYMFSTGAMDCRKTKYIVSKLDLDNRPSTVAQLRSVINNYLTAQFKFMLYKSVHIDGNNDEVSLSPIYLGNIASRYLFKELLDEINTIYSTLNYYTHESCGVHVNVPMHFVYDRDMMINLLITYYTCNDIITNLSNRYGYGQNMVDFRGILGDIMGNMPQEELLDNFLRMKNSLIDCLDNVSVKRFTSMANIRYTASQGPPRIEFRWFRNTMNSTDILSYVELLLLMRDYSMSGVKISKKSFKEFLQDCSSNYPFLYRAFVNKYPLNLKADASRF